jgi:hypothetical protein
MAEAGGNDGLEGAAGDVAALWAAGFSDDGAATTPLRGDGAETSRVTYMYHAMNAMLIPAPSRTSRSQHPVFSAGRMPAVAPAARGCEASASRCGAGRGGSKPSRADSPEGSTARRRAAQPLQNNALSRLAVPHPSQMTAIRINS